MFRFAGLPPIRMFLPVLAVLLLSACATAPYTGRSQYITMSESDEMRLGAQASAEVLKKEPEERGTERAARVMRVGQRIAAVADKPEFDWEFHTIPGKDLNAFCLPGGKVFVYTALLDLTGGSDPELAAVMGHEIAHAVARHGAERASQNQLAGIGQAVTGIAVAVATGSGAAGQAAQSGYGALAQMGFLLPYSRTHETEADHIGIILAAKAGYDPRAALSFWRKMAATDKGKEPPAILSTHPLNQQRIDDLTAEMPEALAYYKPGFVPDVSALNRPRTRGSGKGSAR